MRYLLVILFVALDVLGAAPFCFRLSSQGGGGGSSPVPPPQPTLWWAFEDTVTTGFESRLDSVSSVELSPSGSGAASVSGLIGSGFHPSSGGGFLTSKSGANSAIPALAYTSGNDLSISYWFKAVTSLGGFTTWSDFNFFFHNTTSTIDYSYNLNQELMDQNGAGNVYIDSAIIDISDFSSSDVIVTNTMSNPLIGWHHAVVVYNASSGLITTYIDGANATESDAPGENITTETLGRIEWTISNGSPTVYGDELGIWMNYALTSANVTWLYNSGAGRTYTDIP